MRTQIVLHEDGERIVPENEEYLLTIENIVLFPAGKLGLEKAKQQHQIVHVLLCGKFSSIFISKCENQLYFLVELVPVEFVDAFFDGEPPVQEFVYNHLEYLAYPEEDGAGDAYVRLEALCEAFDERTLEYHQFLITKLHNSEEQKEAEVESRISQLTAEIGAIEESLINSASANKALIMVIERLKEQIEEAAREEAQMRVQLDVSGANERRVEGERLLLSSKVQELQCRVEDATHALVDRENELAVYASKIVERGTINATSSNVNSNGSEMKSTTCSSRQPIKPQKKADSYTETRLLKEDQVIHDQDEEYEPNDCEEPFKQLEFPMNLGLSVLNPEEETVEKTEEIVNEKRFVFTKSTYFIAPKMMHVNIAENTVIREVRTSSKSGSNSITMLQVNSQVQAIQITNSPHLNFFKTPEGSVLHTLQISASGLTLLSIPSDLTCLLNLDVSETSIEFLDLHLTPKLQKLNTSFTQVFELEVSFLQDLREILCISCPISVLDVSNNLALEVLNLSGTSVSLLDVHENAKLKFLALDETNIADVDLCANEELIHVSASYSPLRAIDCSRQCLLQSLNLAYSSVEELSFEKLPELSRLDISGLKISDFGFLQQLEALRLLKIDKIVAGEGFIFHNTRDLQELSLQGSSVSQIDITELVELRALDVLFTQITQLDITANTKLEVLRCEPHCEIIVPPNSSFYSQHKSDAFFKWHLCQSQ